MPTLYELPLAAGPQKFTVLLAEAVYQLTLRWRDPAPGWVLDIADQAGNPILQGTALVTGADLLGQYQYLGIGGQLWVARDAVGDAVAGFADLGVDTHLYFVMP
jgi:predicted Zn-dependent protease with MMP-like domain